mmetsp:Transcript_6155/g.8958  ORF Transcript_6155/g.8958 Transcript_6155/m.8958 type:complete len:126 (-) Transcript_6155:79-456(-)
MSSIITVRCIRSFEYRTIKLMVIPNINLEEMTIDDLEKIVQNEIKTKGAYRAHRTKKYDCFKLYAVKQGHKANCLVINMENDETLMLEARNVPLSKLGVTDESEISYFVKEEYLEYKKNPVIKWE